MEIDYNKGVCLHLTKHGWAHINVTPWSPGEYFWPYEEDKTLRSDKGNLFNNNRKVSFAPFYYLDHKLIFN